MRLVPFDTVSASNPLQSFPLEIREGTPLAGSLGSIAILLPTAAALLVPFVLLGQHLLADADARALILERPGMSLQIALALGLWALLFALPAQRYLGRLFKRRAVAIDGVAVTVAERGLLGRSRWREPLSSYAGLTHHVRASVSGTRHELILVHPEVDKSILLMSADRISEGEIARVAKFLDRPEIPARDLYRFRAPAVPSLRGAGLAEARA
jgi:hypothetical protein